MNDDGHHASRPVARRATVDDAAALARLRAVLFDSMARSGDRQAATWRPGAETWFRRHVAQAARFAAFVVDDAVLGPVSAACGICDDRPPGPGVLGTVRGHVFSVATDPRHRRRGHARACVTALLTWFRLDTAVAVVELKASAQGSALYAELGFRATTDPTVRLVLEDTTAGDPPMRRLPIEDMFGS